MIGYIKSTYGIRTKEWQKSVEQPTKIALLNIWIEFNKADSKGSIIYDGSVMG